MLISRVTEGALPASLMKHSARNLQASNDCCCPVGEPELRLAAEEEFLAMHNAVVECLQSEGALTTANATVKATESVPAVEHCDLSSGFDSAGSRHGRFFGRVGQSNLGSCSMTADYSPAGAATECAQVHS